MNTRPSKKTGSNTAMVGLAAGLLLSICPAQANDGIDPFSAMSAVPDQMLSALRGGFTTSDGIDLNIGMEQITLIGGEIKTRLILDLSELDRASASTQSNMQDQSKLIQLIQSGENNVFTMNAAEGISSGVMTVIQNSLDMQLIQNLTLVNIDVSNLSKFRSSALGESINQELAKALR